jgi:hypothetical protein
MVWNQAPRIANGFRLPKDFPQSFEKVIPVGIATEYRPPFNAPDHDVVESTCSVDSGFPWHAPSLPLPILLCQLKNLTTSPFTLIRIAMLEASHLASVSVAQLSFARALTETRLFLKILLSNPEALMWSTLWTAFVHCCSCHPVHFKPDRQFPRDRQQYRRKSRGLENHPRGPKPKYNTIAPHKPERETLKDSKGRLYLLS